MGLREVEDGPAAVSAAGVRPTPGPRAGSVTPRAGGPPRTRRVAGPVASACPGRLVVRRLPGLLRRFPSTRRVTCPVVASMMRVEWTDRPSGRSTAGRSSARRGGRKRGYRRGDVAARPGGAPRCFPAELGRGPPGYPGTRCSGAAHRLGVGWGQRESGGSGRASGLPEESGPAGRGTTARGPTDLSSPPGGAGLARVRR